jgi:hypothetical protein
MKFHWLEKIILVARATLGAIYPSLLRTLGP